MCPASYHNTAQLPPSDSRMFSLEIPLESQRVGEYGDVYFGLLPKTRKHRNGPPLSTRASLHARPWSEVDREAQQISCPSKQREALAPTKNCVSAASLMNLRKNRGARQRAAHHAIHKGAKLCPSLFPIWLSRREFAFVLETAVPPRKRKHQATRLHCGKKPSPPQ